MISEHPSHLAKTPRVSAFFSAGASAEDAGEAFVSADLSFALSFGLSLRHHATAAEYRGEPKKVEATAFGPRASNLSRGLAPEKGILGDRRTLNRRSGARA